MRKTIKRSKEYIKKYPSQLILVAFFLATLCGSLLLNMSISQNVPMDFIDVFFTAASLTTVTGALTVPLSNFTFFGKIIITILMQIGGLGLMTMSLFLVTLFADIGLYTHTLAQDILSIESFKDIKRILIFMFSLTFIVEICGTIASFISLYTPEVPWQTTLGNSIFHAISGFCNAGFSLFNEGMIDHNGNTLLMVTTIIIMLIGGLGFITWHELISWIQHHRQEKTFHISWHSKLILKTFSSTVIIFSLLYWLLEHNNAFFSMPQSQSILNSLFLCISTKSTGFLPVGINTLQLSSVLIIMISLFIGSAPASTGSGVKLSVFAIFLATIKTAILSRNHAEIYGRRIAKNQVYKAVAIIMAAATWIFIASFFLLITETNWRFIDVIFETVSAFSNGGISTGMTPWLSWIGKIIIMISMLVGRIGAFTLIVGIRRNLEANEYSYPEEKVILG